MLKQHDATWYDMRDAVCDAYARFDKEMHEPGINLEKPSVPLDRGDEIA